MPLFHLLRSKRPSCLQKIQKIEDGKPLILRKKKIMQKKTIVVESKKTPHTFFILLSVQKTFTNFLFSLREKSVSLKSTYLLLLKKSNKYVFLRPFLFFHLVPKKGYLTPFGEGKKYFSIQELTGNE